MNLLERRETYNGFGEALSRAFEMVVTPGIFGGLGYLLDRAAGTVPLFTIAFFVVVFGYVSWRMWWDYDRRMSALEEQMGIRRPAEGSR